MNSHLLRRTSSGLFSRDVSFPVVMREFNFESNPEFHEDGNGDERALGIIRKFASYFDGNIYLFVTDHKLHRAESPMSIDRIFRKSPVVGELDRVELNFDVGEPWPLSAAIVDLSDFAYRAEDPILFHTMQSMFVFSDYSKESIASRAIGWGVGETEGKTMVFDRKAMVGDLAASDLIAFFRHFSSENGYFESMCAVGPIDYLDGRVVPCLEEACDDYSVSKYCENFVEAY